MKPKFVTFALIVLLVPTAKAQTTNSSPQIPDEVAYRILFYHVASLKERADRAATVGQDRSSVRSLVRKQAGLSESEGELLETVALDCENKLAAQNAKARTIFQEIRTRYPFGIFNPSFPPRPDPRLRELQQERDNITLACRDHLRAFLGEEAFAKLDNLVKRKTAPSRNHATAGPSQTN